MCPLVNKAESLPDIPDILISQASKALIYCFLDFCHAGIIKGYYLVLSCLFSAAERHTLNYAVPS